MPREQRYVGAQLTLSYGREQIILERNGVSEELASQYVELYDVPDRPLEVRWKGHMLPYRRSRIYGPNYEIGATPAEAVEMTS